MKTKTILITFLLVATLLSCKKENTFSNYKYADKPQAFTCEGINSKLYNEALYSFEDDILNYYKKGNENYRLDLAYSQAIRNSVFGRLKMEEIVSKHTVEIFEALKKQNNLWAISPSKTQLNYNNVLTGCISSNIKDNALKTTFDALISTNSMSPKLFGPALVTKYRNTLNDKNLALYVALDLYYAKMFNIDFSKVNLDKPEQKVDFNVLPPKTEVDPHAGHNH
ncbi:MAG: hypothetical protein P8K68_08060 [Algibacter sp.]|uniref:hypothetical protein n=1 Tax=Algibacter sp. TaxID=1872428 RepID=UPI002628262D|nr:hypothetical protein [Algibacter sp.]MDG1729870.1 hypothetical protein [Algibacter sp.]MDG2178726.1 hypothetical protein [Algibacter sp.]